MRKVLTSAHRHWRLRSVMALATVGAVTMSMGVVALGAATVQATAAEPCIPKDAWTETVQHDAVTHTEQRMTDPGQPYVATVAEIWANWQPNETQGAQDYEPVWPTDARGTWLIHKEGVPEGHEGPDGVYQQGEGNSPWFYRQAGSPGQDYVAPTYETVTVVDKAAWTEIIRHAAVTCDDSPPPPAALEELAPAVTFTDPTCENLDGAGWDGTLEAVLDYDATGDVGAGETVTVEAMIEPALTDEYEFADGAETEFTHTFDDITLEDCVQGEETVVPKPKPEADKPGTKPTVAGVQTLAPQASVPTAVAAGLVGEAGMTTTQLLGQGLAGMGLVMMLTAGWVVLSRRPRGAHLS